MKKGPSYQPVMPLVLSPVISSFPGNLFSSCCFNLLNLGAYPHPPLKYVEQNKKTGMDKWVGERENNDLR